MGFGINTIQVTATMNPLLGVLMSMSARMATSPVSVAATQTATIMWDHIRVPVSLGTRPGRHTMDVGTPMSAVLDLMLSVVTLVRDLLLIVGSVSTLRDLMTVKLVALEEPFSARLAQEQLSPILTMVQEQSNGLSVSLLEREWR